jgi:hypothetical protein
LTNYNRMDSLFNLFTILLVLAIMVRFHSSGGGAIVKPKTDSKKPKTFPASQEIRKNKKN